jgi:GNAT superfamily N-acetyltransferase
VTYPSSVEIVDLGTRHIPAAAELVAARVRRLRAEVPILPGHWAAADAWEAPLRSLTEGAGGCAAVDGDRLLGFMGAERFGDADRRRAWCPEWMHAATREGGRAILERLYREAGRRWVADGARTQLVSTLVSEPAERDAWVWLGFGGLVVDAMRDLSPIPVPADRVRIRRAGVEDAAAVIELESGLRRHLVASPVFLTLPIGRDVDAERARLTDPQVATFVAETDAGAVAFLRIGPSADDVAMIVRDPGTASITGAYTRPDERGTGIASLLLDGALDWARRSGYVRCGVDFESANLEAVAFWSRWFRPVTLALVRRLHPEAGSDAALPGGA